MGKRKSQQANLENISPEQKRATSASYILLTNMKTRSSKATAASNNESDSSPPSGNVITETIEYPAVQLIQDLATSASVTVITSDSATTELSQPDKSPLAESSINEQTPEKSDSATQVINELLKEAGQIANATPTANLKILCEAVDHDESGTSDQSQEVQIRNDPVTPTANLKMLITAASPEIRSLELSKSRLFEDDEDMEDDDEDDMDDAKPTTKRKQSRGPTRKQKSLGILCRRFMAQFEEFPSPTSRIEVCLDELAAHLGTERRRIYDIVNVLESVEMMSRRAKNRYLWHGKTNLNSTLVKLKYLAETEQVAKQLELVKELEVARLYGRKCKTNGDVQSEEEAVSDHPKYKEYVGLFGEGHRKERSLGVMSQKFLMLFLTGRTKTINLDMAAKLLLGDPMVETKQTNSQFKTKIRRLYDIANILASLNLICKVHVTELRGRKPAFSYIGPDVEELSLLDEYQYLKNVEVVRPGRTTLDMKMEELKRKMEAHVAAEAEANKLRQVPPVTIQAPDLEQIKQSLSSKPAGSKTNLSQLAAEHAAAKRGKSIIKPKSPLPTNRPFVVIQQGAVGGTSVLTTSQVPQFMDSDGNPVRMVQLEGMGSPILLTAPQSAPSSAPVSATSTPQAGTRRILPQPKAQQHITLYAPPHSAQTTPTRTPIQLHSTKRPAPLGISIPASIVSAAEPSNQQKRTASQMEAEEVELQTVEDDGTHTTVTLLQDDTTTLQEETVVHECSAEETAAVMHETVVSAEGTTTTTALIQEEDGTYSSYYLTKADNEYYLINKKLRMDGSGLPGEESEEPQAVIIEQVPEDKIGELGQAFEVLQNKNSHEVTSPTPVPIVYSTPSTEQQTVYTTPSGQHTISLTSDQQGHAVINPVTAGRQITFLASPVTEEATVTAESQQVPTQGAIRHITLK